MQSTGLFLKQDQVWAGMTVAVCLEGEDTPQEDEEGDPLVLKALISTGQLRTVFYPLKGGIEQPAEGALLGRSIANFNDNVRLMPVRVFSLEDAPREATYIPFVDGECLTIKHPSRHDEAPDTVFVYVDEDGTPLLSSYYTYALKRNPGREFQLPDNALLVPIGQGRSGENPQV